MAGEIKIGKRQIGYRDPATGERIQLIPVSPKSVPVYARRVTLEIALEVMDDRDDIDVTEDLLDLVRDHVVGMFVARTRVVPNRD